MRSLPKALASVGPVAKGQRVLPGQMKREPSAHFRMWRDSPLYAPARGLLQEISVESDGCRCLVQELCESSFDATLFEIFLFVMFSAAGHEISLKQRPPRLLINRAGCSATVDTVVPTSAADTLARQGGPQPCFINGPGGALFRKLANHAWRVPHAAGRPLIIAVEDACNDAEPIVALSAAMLHFLFGTARGSSSEGAFAAAQEMNRLFPSGFFSQVESQNISAILLCSDNGTIEKFNRIGQEGEYRTNAVKMLRHGHCQSEEGASCSFLYEVGQRRDKHESWNEGTMLIHNPFARHPLPRRWLGSSAEAELRDGAVVLTFSDAFHPHSSVTETMPGSTPAWWMEMRANLIARELASHPG